MSDAEKRGKLRLVASRDGRDGSVTIHQDVSLYASVLEKGESVSYENRHDRHVWVQVARGRLQLNGLDLGSGDGVAINGNELLRITAHEKAEFLLFDLA